MEKAPPRLFQSVTGGARERIRVGLASIHTPDLTLCSAWPPLKSTRGRLGQPTVSRAPTAPSRLPPSTEGVSRVTRPGFSSSNHSSSLTLLIGSSRGTHVLLTRSPLKTWPATPLAYLSLELRYANCRGGADIKSSLHGPNAGF